MVLDAGRIRDDIAAAMSSHTSGVSNVSDDMAAAMARTESEHGSESATPRTEVVQRRASVDLTRRASAHARRSLEGAWPGFGSSAELASARVAATPSLTLLVGDDNHSWGVDLTRSCIWHLSEPRSTARARRPNALPFARAVTLAGSVSPQPRSGIVTPARSRAPSGVGAPSSRESRSSPPSIRAELASLTRLSQHAYAPGRTWQRGDVLGCMVDIPNGTLEWTLNGESLGTAPSSIPCAGVRTARALVPAASPWTGQSLTFNFGGPGRSFAHGPPPRYRSVYDGLYGPSIGTAGPIDAVAEAAADVVNGAIGTAVAEVVASGFFIIILFSADISRESCSQFDSPPLTSSDRPLLKQ